MRAHFGSHFGSADRRRAAAALLLTALACASPPAAHAEDELRAQAR
jgi:hypothetical protein